MTVISSNGTEVGGFVVGWYSQSGVSKPVLRNVDIHSTITECIGGDFFYCPTNVGIFALNGAEPILDRVRFDISGGGRLELYSIIAANGASVRGTNMQVGPPVMTGPIPYRAMSAGTFKCAYCYDSDFNPLP